MNIHGQLFTDETRELIKSDKDLRVALEQLAPHLVADNRLSADVETEGGSYTVTVTDGKFLIDEY